MDNDSSVETSRSMKTISIKVPEGLAVRLDQAVAAAQRSKSDLIREAVEQYLARGDIRLEGSFSTQGADLAGCLEGPHDLSFNPRHLDGYGT